MSILSQFKQSQNTDFPNVRPSLDLRFALTKKLDPRITFTRGSTGTYFGSDGIMRTAGVNEPRFDHDPITGQSLGLLIEESRTNLLTSSIPQAGVWSSVNTTLISNSEIAPDGTQTATLINSDLTYGARYINLNSSLTTATNYTQTFFVKAGTTRFVQVAPSTGFASTTFANFELIGDGIIGTSTVDSASIQRFPNGWYRIRVTQLSTSNPAGGRMLLVLGTSLTNARLPDTPVLSCYVWGAQLEVGAFATSYIPTTASIVPRSVDNGVMSGNNLSSWYNSTEGTFFTDVKSSTSFISNINATPFGIFTAANNIVIVNYNAASSIWLFRNSIGTNNAFFTQTMPVSSNRKSIATYRTGASDYYTAAFGGSNIKDSTKTVTLRTDQSYLELNPNRSGLVPLNGTISRLTYYPIQLTNQQLINLTS